MILKIQNFGLINLKVVIHVTEIHYTEVHKSSTLGASASLQHIFF